MVQLSYCQKTYPYRSIIDNDTVCVISKEQVVKINLTYEDLKYCKLENSNLVDIIDSKDKIIGDHDTIIEALINQKMLYEKQFYMSNDVVLNQTQVINLNKATISKLKVQRNFFIIIGILLFSITLIK